MPALFVGHGNPMNSLAHNAWTSGWARLGASVPRPKAIVAVSAHWYLPGSRVTANSKPPTIHDFGGFPRELHEVLPKFDQLSKSSGDLQESIDRVAALDFDRHSQAVQRADEVRDTLDERIRLVERLNDVTAHAEMMAFTAAAEYLGGKFLRNCTMYVTMTAGDSVRDSALT